MWMFWWLESQLPHYCNCGCGTEIKITLNHKYDGIPKCIQAHYKPHVYDDPWKSFEVRNKLSIAARKNNPSKRPEVRLKISCSHTGKKHNDDTLKKLSDAMLNRNLVGEKNPSWRGGTSFYPYCYKFNDKLKEEIRTRYDRRCYICNKHEDENILSNGKKIRLSIHHIDRDKEQGCNGKKWLLVPLCISCHAKSHKN